MEYSFFCFGHANITGKHRNTIEFTKDKELTLNGDCIIGVNSDFDFEKIKNLISKNKDKKLKIKIIVDDLTEEIACDINHSFNDNHEIVIRKSEFHSKRTLGVKAAKSAKDLDRKLIEKIKEPKKKMKIEFQFVTTI